jgi:hypothetical protein
MDENREEVQIEDEEEIDDSLIFEELEEMREEEDEDYSGADGEGDR